MLPKHIISVCIFITSLLVTPVYSDPVKADSVQALEKPILATLSPINTHHGFSTPIAIRFTYKNISQKPVSFLIRGTALSGKIRDHMVEVYFANKQLDYQGPIFKRLPPQKDEYIVLAPGEARSVDLQLEKAFSIHKVGTYKILHQPRAEIQVSDIPLEIELTQARIAQKITPTFRACNAVQSSDIDAALGVAEAYAANTAGGMRNVPENKRSSSPRYREWFGTYVASRWDKVQRNINQIAAIANRTKMTFDCGCAEGDDNTIAYVYPSLEYQVFVCPLFWQLGRSGVNSQAGTIIHEISHFQSVARTDDHAYGLTDSRNLARGNPNAAANNAENYQFYSENPRSLAWIGSSITPNPSPPGSVEEPIEEVVEPPAPNYAFLLPLFDILLDDDSGTPAPPIVVLPPAPTPTPPENIIGRFALSIDRNQDQASGGAKQYRFNQRNSNLEIKTYNSSGGLVISLFGVRQQEDATVHRENWFFVLRSRTDERLTRGTYGIPFPNISSNERHRLDIYRADDSTLSCNRYGPGYFRIYEIEYNGDEVIRLVADVATSCTDRTSEIRASIDFDASRASLEFDSTAIPTSPISPQIPPLEFNGAKLVIEGDDDSPLGGGARLAFDSRTSAFRYILFNRIDTRSLNLLFRGRNEFWNIEFFRGKLDADKLKGSPLSVGIYSNTSPDEYGNSVAPILSIRRVFPGSEECDFRGEFRIHEIQYNETFTELHNLVADFKGSCFGSDSELRGSARINNTSNDVTYNSPQPVSEELYPPQVPLQYAGGRFTLNSPFRANPSQTIDTSTHNITITSSNGPRPTIKIDIRGAHSYDSIEMKKADDTNDSANKGYFSPGVYAPALLKTFHNLEPDKPAYSIRGVPNRCEYGRFTIHQIEYNELDEVVKLKADFEDYQCDDYQPVRASIIFDSTLPHPPFPPITLPSGPLKPAQPELIHAGAILSSLDSETGDIATYTSADSNFQLIPTEDYGGFRILIKNDLGDRSLTFNRSKLTYDPRKTSPLEPGEYAIQAQGAWIQNIGEFCSFSSRSNELVRIFEIKYNDKNQITKLIADFSAQCDYRGFTKHTSVHYDTSLPPFPFPAVKIPEGSAVPTPLDYDQNSMHIIDRDTGQVHMYGGNMNIHLARVQSEGGLSLRIGAAGQSFGDSWSLLFKESQLDINPNSKLPIKVGEYTVNGGNIRDGVSPEIRVVKDGNYTCNIGSFRIFELELNDNNQVTKLLMDFIQSCPNRGNFSGSIRIVR